MLCCYAVCRPALLYASTRCAVLSYAMLLPGADGAFERRRTELKILVRYPPTPRNKIQETAFPVQIVLKIRFLELDFGLCESPTRCPSGDGTEISDEDVVASYRKEVRLRYLSTLPQYWTSHSVIAYHTLAQYWKRHSHTTAQYRTAHSHTLAQYRTAHSLIAHPTVSQYRDS
eukprot:2146258-Rhodomonas_salina.5